MPNPTAIECIARLALSALFGGIVGLERELRLKGAGLRTHLIVSFASCMMMLVSKYGFLDMLAYDSVGLDPSRIAAGIVTAIGFLGAGTIFSRSQGVTGLTTAAGLWATVGVGMAVGAGMYLISVFAVVFIVGIQAALHRDHAMLGHVAAVILVRMDDQPGALDRLRAELTQLNLTPRAVRYEREGELLTVELQLERLSCPVQELGGVLAPLMNQPWIKSILW